MEMYADVEARGGVLEPEGIVGIKYRKDKQLETMVRLDPTYASLKKQMQDTGLSKEEVDAIKKKMTAREQQLLPVYAQISLQFADLHDRAGRMKAKGVIRDSLEWHNARRFFYWRVRRRLNEEYILRRIAASTTAAGIHQKATTASTTPQARTRHLHLLEAWCGIANFDKSDREVAIWYEENRKLVHDKVEGLKAEAIAGEMRDLVRIGSGSGKDHTDNAAWKGVRDLLRVMPVEERDKVLKYLKQV
jgi:acetyl-CoA carboxylase/biotin carboxylase 1